MNIEALKALREFEQDKHINMSCFFQETQGSTNHLPKDFYTDNWCKTAACHAGWEVLRKKEEVLEKLTMVDVKKFNAWDFSLKSLGLTSEEAFFLFRITSHLGIGDCSPSEAKARLDYMIEQERVPITLQEEREWYHNWFLSRQKEVSA